MAEVIIFDLTQDFIQELGSFIHERYVGQGKDLSRLAVVFGGKRPALFLKRELSRRLKQAYVPPQFFSMDEFVEYLTHRENPLMKVSDLDACYLIYQLARDIRPNILKGRNTFAKFLSWAREILAFIEQLDLEDVPTDSLANIQMNAAIGYEVPANINNLLKNIVALREAYHQRLTEQKKFTRGLLYLKAGEGISRIDFDEFDQILFCNFFYLHKTEEKVVTDLFKRGRATLLLQGHESQWPVLQRFSQALKVPIKPVNPQPPAYRLKLYAGFDTHSQVGIVREILKGIKDVDRTVIVLPNPDRVIALLSEVSSLIRSFNVSLGYPLNRSPLYSLFQDIFKAQKSRKKQGYYTPDYLKALWHPFVKNLKIYGDPSVTRVLIHKMEEFLSGQEPSSLGGSLFLSLADIEGKRNLTVIVKEILGRMDVRVNLKQLQDALRQLHKLLFIDWQEIKNLKEFAGVLENFLEVLLAKSSLRFYPMNLQMVQRLLAIKDELNTAAFHEESFDRQEIFKIFLDRLNHEMMAFAGSPLKGLQILGLLETRSLNFDDVIIMDVNETVLPKLRIFEPLIPREVTIGLNLNRLEKEEEIQRYQFMRLLASAKNVHLIYEENPDKERSRFIEELVWERQKATGQLEIGTVPQGRFQVTVLPKQTEIRKNNLILNYLKSFCYSATSVNTYMRCPLRFYYQYVLGLDQKDDLLEEPESVDVGNFLHQLLATTFKRFIGRKPRVDDQFRQHFQKTFEELFNETLAKRMKADAFLLKKVLEVRLQGFLDHEAERNVAEIVCLEKKYEGTVHLSKGVFKFTYRVDRIDRPTPGGLLLVDYKTGSLDPMPGDLSRLSQTTLTREMINETMRSFQIPLYYYFLTQEYQQDVLDAAFYNLRTIELKYFSRRREQTDTSRFIEQAMQMLDFILGEILNPQVPFKADDRDLRYCQSCPFYDMCR